ncbi:elongation factor G [Alistipes sp. ZOR0009]|uniref:elongation factor G n=1 Tax=Alistipes sp. ZOR0009 TaxID=1339253 RepID=UPI0006463CDA|nr:elongation factor G [Alistipes sp. ZOR0009]
MRTYQTNEIKNVVLLGNSGSGKTTMAEGMLYEGKVIDRRGSIDAQNTVSDYTEVEHIYKRSIYSTVLFTEYLDHKLNIVDTPGSDDFSGGVFSAFRIADTGIMVINAVNGVEVGTQIFGRYAEENEKPFILAVNQLDHDKANWDNTIESLQKTFGKKVVIIQYPLTTGADFDTFIDVLTMKMYKHDGDSGVVHELPIPADEEDRANELHNALVEAAAENDDALMEMFFEKGTLSEEDIRIGLRAGIAHRDVFPVLCLSAKKDVGIRRMMEFLINNTPSPNQKPKPTTIDGTEVAFDAAGAPCLFVFKTQIEQHLGEISYFKVVSGKISEGMELINNNNGTREKISQIFATAGKNRVKVPELVAGDVGCTVKLKNTKTSHTLAGNGKTWEFAPMAFPEAKFRTAIRPKNQADEEKLGELLNKAHQEDPTILVEYSKELKQTIVSGQGEHHLNILKWQLANINKLEIEFYPPKIPYRETITKIANASYRHKKQSGGAGQFGEVHIIIEPIVEGVEARSKFKIDGKELNLNLKGKEVYPLDWGGHLEFYNCIVGGAIDARFLPAIQKGIMEKMEEGPLTGSYARDIRVYVYDGKMHPVDSNELSFKLAGRYAFKDAFKNAGPKIMEPIYNVTILVPAERMGDVMSDLQNRRAMIEGMSSAKSFEKIVAKVPLSEMHKYSTTLSSLTSGSATYSMKFSSYEQVPSEVQEKLLKAYEAVAVED